MYRFRRTIAFFIVALMFAIFAFACYSDEGKFGGNTAFTVILTTICLVLSVMSWPKPKDEVKGPLDFDKKEKEPQI